VQGRKLVANVAAQAEAGFAEAALAGAAVIQKADAEERRLGFVVADG
jgi:hypothetical protein